jgi:hypothetical protein
LMVATSASAQGGLVFSDGFESGNTNQWSADDFRNKCVVTSSSIDGRAPLSGVKMVECNWNGLVAWNAPDAYSTLKLGSFSANQEFLVRVWARVASDKDAKDGAKLMRLDALPGYSFIIEVQADRTLKAHWEIVNGATGPSVCWGCGTIADGNWHQIEVYEGPSGGKLWVDNSLVYTRSTRANITSVPLYLLSNWSNNPGWEHDAANHVNFDSIEVYSDQGSGATGSMSAGTIAASGGGTTTQQPAPPTNLRIVQ